MVPEPYLSIAPPNPAAPQEVETGNDDSDRTDDADSVSRFTETARLPDT
jgi:hypothetical protein